MTLLRTQETELFLNCIIDSLYINFRDLLTYVFIPVIRREVEIFYNDVWNAHRIRQQKDAQMPKGVPDHMFNFPTVYGAEDHDKISCGVNMRSLPNTIA